MSALELVVSDHGPQTLFMDSMSAAEAPHQFAALLPALNATLFEALLDFVSDDPQRLSVLGQLGFLESRVYVHQEFIDALCLLICNSFLEFFCCLLLGQGLEHGYPVSR